jgi:predicted lipoprotein
MAKIISVSFLVLGAVVLVGSVDAQETGKKVIATPTAPNAIGPSRQFEPERRSISRRAYNMVSR